MIRINMHRKVVYLFVFIVILLFINNYFNFKNRHKSSTKIINEVFKGKPIVIAHRGASGYALEHTLTANALAYVMGADYLELDVVLTKDDVPIVMHDHTLDRTTDVMQLYNVSRARKDLKFYAIDFTLDEIKRLNVIRGNSIFLQQQSLKISTFEEQLDFLFSFHKRHSKYSSSKISKTTLPGINVEFKSTSFYKSNDKPFAIDIVMNLIEKHGYKHSSDPILLQSFNLDDLIYLKKTLKTPFKLIYLLKTNISSEELDKAVPYINAIGPSFDTLIHVVDNKHVKPSKFYKLIKKKQLPILPWTLRKDLLPSYVNNFDELLKILLVNLRVNGIITNFPDLVADFIDKNKETFD